VKRHGGHLKFIPNTTPQWASRAYQRHAAAASLLFISNGTRHRRIARRQYHAYRSWWRDIINHGTASSRQKRVGGSAARQRKRSRRGLGAHQMSSRISSGAAHQKTP